MSPNQKNGRSVKLSSDILIFDRDLIRRNRERASRKFPDHDFLFQWSKNQISERLYDINRRFPKAVQLGSRSPISEEHEKIDTLLTLDLPKKPVESHIKKYIQASEEYLPINLKSMDLILSNLNLHTVNDLPGTLLQIRNCLKDDGLFIASILGGETLHELRLIMTETEMSLFGGVSPHIAPFADKPQIGDLLQRANFALPVIDSDIVTVTYDNAFKLLHDLRGMGEGNAIIEKNKTPLGKEFFMRVAQKYQEQFSENDGHIIASFEVIFMLGWAPHSSQQKPLRPGSAKHSLAEALESKKTQGKSSRD